METEKHGANRPDPMADVRFHRECGPEVGSPESRAVVGLPPKVRPTKRHEVKSFRKWFDLMLSGEAFWTVRKNDRDYRVADELLVREYSFASNFYTGRELLFAIVAVTDCDDLPSFLFPAVVWPKESTVILSLAPLAMYPWGQSLVDPRD